MNRIIEITAMAVAGLSLFLVSFVGFAALSGKDMSQVAVIGRLFPAPPEPGAGDARADAPASAGAPSEKGLSDEAVIEASLGILSAWTLPSPFSTSELRALSEALEHEGRELDQREQALARREKLVQEDEQELEERLRTLEELRTRLEGLQQELAERDVELARREDAALAGEEARWAEVGRVIGGLEDAQAGKRLLEYEPQEAARILRALGDDERAGEILNQVQGTRWKEYVDAYTAGKARGPSAKRRG
jgi:flagellar motility protein MotE (MotC chaperone)